MATNHTCERAICGWRCWEENGNAIREIRISYGDAGVIDAETACDCEDHDAGH